MVNLQTIHQKYRELESLEKTCDWLLENYNHTINRQRLSRMFKEAGLHVNPPNGWPDLYWEDSTSHLDPAGKFAASMIQAAYDDLTDGDVPRMDKLSAAYFLSGELYEICLQLVMRNAGNFSINKNTVPPGIDIDEIIILRQIYERNRNFWLPQ